MRILYYKISEDGYPVIFPEQLEDGLIAYIEGEEPRKLKDAIDRSKQKEHEQSERFVAEKYLKETDWYVTRFTETKKEIPEEIKRKREEARLRIR